MRKTPKHDAADAFIEQMGLIMAADGLPRIGGRLLGFLLITDGDVSLDDIARRLRVSKPSVSTNARLLEQRGVIEKVTRVADRRDYYRIADDVIGRTMQQRLNRLQRLQSCIAGARTSMTGVPPTVATRLDDFSAACTQLSTMTEKALSRWRAIGPRAESR
jgi:DNA-binding transcriptional regulator GbsR (MarR family)